MAETQTKTVEPIQNGLAFERPLLEMEQKIEELRRLAQGTHLDLSGEIQALQERLEKQTAEVYSRPDALGEGQRRAARRPAR